MSDRSAKRNVARLRAGRVRFNARAFKALAENRLAKGDAIAVARLAGIQAAKRTAEWIPLCHTIPLDHVGVAIELEEGERCAKVRAEVAATWSTGVEMEALVAVQAACLALYDMAKGARPFDHPSKRSRCWRRPAADPGPIGAGHGERVEA